MTNGWLCVCTLSGMAYGLSHTDGVHQWSHDFGKPVFSSPVCIVNGICVGCVDGSIYCLSDDGELVSIMNQQNPRTESEGKTNMLYLQFFMYLFRLQ